MKIFTDDFLEKIKQFFCWHKWTEIEGHPECHRYQCYKCKKTKK